MKIQDLDVLKPEARFVKIGGKEIDVSFIPCGITFDIDRIANKLIAMDVTEIEKGGEKAREAFNLTIELCSKFCSFKHPELDENWFMTNATPAQVAAFAEAVKDALYKAYTGVDTSGGTGKN